jgi:multicomponent Na+:H+ antiporter subunit F
VNQWLWAATALLVLMVPLLGVALLAGRLDALVAAQTAGTNMTLVLLMLSEGFKRSSYTTLAVVAAVLTFAGGLVFVRFFDRELDP